MGMNTVHAVSGNRSVYSGNREMSLPIFEMMCFEVFLGYSVECATVRRTGADAEGESRSLTTVRHGGRPFLRQGRPGSLLVSLPSSGQAGQAR